MPLLSNEQFYRMSGEKSHWMTIALATIYELHGGVDIDPFGKGLWCATHTWCMGAQGLLLSMDPELKEMLRPTWARFMDDKRREREAGNV